MKKLSDLSMKRLPYQSRGIEASTPSRYAWSSSDPRGQRRYGALFVRKTFGGTSVAITVRSFSRFVMSRNAIRGRSGGASRSSFRHASGNSANADLVLPRWRLSCKTGRTTAGLA